MPHAVLHLLAVVIPLEFLRKKWKFPLSYVLIGGIAGLIPDVDGVAYYIVKALGSDATYLSVHRTFIHSLFIPLALFAIACLFHIFSSRKRFVRYRNITAVIAFGILIHLILDLVVSGTLAVFYPLSTAQFGLNLVGFAPGYMQQTIIQGLDGIALLIWVVYLFLGKKLKSFI